MRIAGRLLPLAIVPLSDATLQTTAGSRAVWLAGLRYRRTKLQPSLHPGIPTHMPLRLDIVSESERHAFMLTEDSPVFERHDAVMVPPGPACRGLSPSDLTYDLRVAW